MPSIRRKRLAALVAGTVLLCAGAGAFAHTAETLEEAKVMAAEFATPIVIDFYTDW